MPTSIRPFRAIALLMLAVTLPAGAASSAGSGSIPAPITASPENPLTAEQVRLWSEWKAGDACESESFLGVVRVTPLACRRHVEDWRESCADRVGPPETVFTTPDDARAAAKEFLHCVLPQVQAKPLPSDYA